MKRLRELGWDVSLVVKYDDADTRYWTILIKNASNTLCTCYKRSPEEYYFQLNIPNGNIIKLSTKSVLIISDTLRDNMIW